MVTGIISPDEEILFILAGADFRQQFLLKDVPGLAFEITRVTAISTEAAVEVFYSINHNLALPDPGSRSLLPGENGSWIGGRLTGEATTDRVELTRPKLMAGPQAVRVFSSAAVRVVIRLEYKVITVSIPVWTELKFQTSRPARRSPR